MKMPETLDEAIDHLEKVAHDFAESYKKCVSEEAHEEYIESLTWLMRQVEWLKELKDRRENELRHQPERPGHE